MKLNGKEYNFGRLVYVTLIRSDLASSNFMRTDMDKVLGNGITLCYDTARDVNFCTRIDFWVRHTDGRSSENPIYSLCKLDLYNVGAGIRQFINAYDQYNQGYWKQEDIKRFGLVIQVGYRDAPLTTIFSGWVASYNVERQQSDKSVDEIYHLYAQNPGQVPTPLTDQKATSGDDYIEKAIYDTAAPQTFVTGDAYIRDTVMKRQREVRVSHDVPMLNSSESWTIQNGSIEKGATTSQSLATPDYITITPLNFDKYFTIKYIKAGNKTVEDADLKKEWTTFNNFRTFPLDYSKLPNAIHDIVSSRNCDSNIELDFETGLQIIYIWRAGSPIAAPKGLKTGRNWEIINFQNLQKSPTVSAGMIQFELMLEPTMKNMDTIELKLDNNWAGATPSFNISFGNMANAATVAAGANFAGIYNTIKTDEKKAAMIGYGNVFDKRFYILFLEHSGSTHTADWTTRAECYGLEQLKELG